MSVGQLPGSHSALLRLCDDARDAVFRASVIDRIIRNDDELKNYSPKVAVRFMSRAYLRQFETAFLKLWAHEGCDEWRMVCGVDVNPAVVHEGALSGQSGVEVAFLICQQTLGTLLWACYGDQAVIDLQLKGPLDVQPVKLCRVYSRLPDLRRRCEATPAVDYFLLLARIEKECERALALLGHPRVHRGARKALNGPLLPKLREAALGWEDPERTTALEGATKPAKGKRFKPGSCPRCSGPAEVSSTPAGIRKLRCRNPECGHTWQIKRT